MASKIKVDELETADGSGTIALQNQLSGMTTASLPTVTTDKLGTGAVLQVKQSTFADDAGTSSTSYQDIPLSVSITPRATSSKILVQVNIWAGVNDTGQYGVLLQLLRDSTQINMGNAEGSRPRVMGVAYSPAHDYDVYPIIANYLDSPNTTSSTTYKVQFRSGWSGSKTVYINRGGSDSDNAGGARTMSTITVMEIAG